MTASRVHQRCAAIPYGAAELKQVYYRNFSAALLLSSLIHIGIVAGYLVTPASPHLLPGHPPLPPYHPPGVTLVPPPPLYTPGNTGGFSKGNEDVKKGTVELVADNKVSVQTTLASQKQMYNDPSTGEGTGDGKAGGETNGEGEGPIIIEETEEKELYMVEVEPTVLATMKPVYPPLAILSGLEGKVWVKMLVGKDGRVAKVMVIKSTHEIFEEAALEAARGFVFKPGYMSGGPVSVWVSVPFSFQLSSAR